MLKALWLSLTLLSFVDSAVQGLDRFCAMAVEFAVGVLHMLSRVSHRF
jgi:hypothetical protein